VTCGGMWRAACQRSSWPYADWVCGPISAFHFRYRPPWMAGMRGAPWPPALSADSPPPSTEVHHSGGGQVRRLPDAADAGLHRSLSPDPVVVARTRANTRANRNSFHLVDPIDLHTVPTPNRTTEQRRRSVQFILPSPETELAVDESQLRGALGLEQPFWWHTSAPRHPSSPAHVLRSSCGAPTCLDRMLIGCFDFWCRLDPDRGFI